LRRTGSEALDELRIVVAAESELIRLGVRSILRSKPFWSVYEIPGASLDVERIAAYRPGVVLLHVGGPGSRVLEATRQIRELLPKAEVVILGPSRAVPTLYRKLQMHSIADLVGFAIRTDLIQA
jgi:hypothetical protein